MVDVLVHHEEGLDPEAKLMEAASFLENDKVNTNVMPQQDSDQSDMVENEVSIFLLEPSLRVDEMQYALLDNSSSQLLCNDSRDVHRLGVGFASKVEQIYILDVDMRGCSKKRCGYEGGADSKSSRRCCFSCTSVV
ncbi:hypothetical protein Bca52824_009221 [Brassica carinata]|uniref:Uncharacterized protein n=1 Tax=Brassica carinata TaxID=52824 RepID=A0A8X7W9G6_BRACI|nr:hypothetical protein Bca52824_009221 [Brassica carinata]